MQSTIEYAVAADEDSGEVSQGLWHRWFVTYSPLYFFSALCVLVGVFLLARGLDQTDPGGTKPLVLLVLEAYQLCLLLGAALLYRVAGEKRPAIINVQEATTVHYPESLYESFDNTHSERYSSGFQSRDIPVIRTFRPKNTYYRGLYTDGDIQAKDLPMRSEISIVSTVRLYFESPVAKEQQKASKDKD